MTVRVADDRARAIRSADLSPVDDPREHLVARLGILGVTLDPAIARMLPPLRIVPACVVRVDDAGASSTRATAACAPAT